MTSWLSLLPVCIPPSLGWPLTMLLMCVKELCIKCLLALSDRPNQPASCVHSPCRPTLSSASPCCLTPGPSWPCPLLLFSALELPGLFCLLSNCFSWAPRCTVCIIPAPSADFYSILPFLHHRSRSWLQTHRLHAMQLPSKSHPEARWTSVLC